ncbi:hypothetical protein GAW58_02235 [Salmonella enterica subsp. enterica]|nr:hypothetical protein [Salmonella enterica subsp. enterica]
MPENPASYRVVRTKSYLFNKATLTLFAKKKWCFNAKHSARDEAMQTFGKGLFYYRREALITITLNS